MVSTSAMPNKHNDARRHHIPKMRFRVTNWAAYEAGLRRRGSLTLWVSDDAIVAWCAAPRTTPGGQARYSETAIEAAVMVRLVFHQPLRQTEGLLGSLLGLMGLDLPVPDHTTISRRAARLTPVRRTALPSGPVTLVIDSTGLKVFGAGEWHRDKHGVRGPRTWRKLHLSVDAAGNTIVAVTLTTNSEGDASQVGPLLDQTTGSIGAVMADGAYDGEPTYRKVAERDPAAAVVIPPRITAVAGSAAGSEPSQRDRHIQSMADNGRLGWQKQTGYGKRAKAETAMARYKRILGDHLHARELPGQQAEAAIGVAVLNRMIEAGRPNSVRVA
jgi:transposase